MIASDGVHHCLYEYLRDNSPFPHGVGWGTADPDNTSRYIVATDCRQWLDVWNAGGLHAMTVPALMSVLELENDAALWDLNAAAQTQIDTYLTTIQSAMGAATGGGDYLRDDSDDADDSLAGDADDDFLIVPVIYFGEWDAVHGRLIDRDNEAYIPGLVNLQPASATTIVFPQPFGPRNAAGDDVFQEATSIIVGPGAAFADDWDLYHRLMGEVHCGTAAKRDFFGFNWWERQP